MRDLCDDTNTGDGNWPTEGHAVHNASQLALLAGLAQGAILLNFLLCLC